MRAPISTLRNLYLFRRSQFLSVSLYSRSQSMMTNCDRP
ncbi:hypothetical protein APA_3727 [Pseudanabaena sp. lw0831]|nr:hypothetical protein APA_3727 [Pseudanabaena sp. lw0831]